MKKFKFKSLTMRIWTTFTAIILIIICSISLIYLVAFKRMSENAKIQDLKVAHNFLLNSDNYNQANRFDQLKNLQGSGHFIFTINSNKQALIKDINSKIDPPPNTLNNVPPPKGNDLTAKTWMASFIKTGTTIMEQQYKKSYNNQDYIFIISSITNNDSSKSYLISYMPNRQDNGLLYTVLIIGLVFIAIGFVTAKVVANYISKPLKELEDYTVRIAQKDWKNPIDLKNQDEIGRLADSMNRMQRELKRADEEEKMFLQSISHDLKTPVMVIMSHAEAIIDGIFVKSAEENAEIIRDEAIMLKNKITHLLYLNTLDYVLENNNENSSINLHDLLLHIINRLEMVNSKIEWDLDIDQVNISGNMDKIQVSIENVLDNGLRYAKEEIRVSLKKEDSFAVIEIYNDGDNISKEHIDHIFDNFYKDKTGNFGLGLAISKKIIDFYKGEIKAVNREKGVSFIIKYPL
ncbi:MAG: HAMP domain-containing histidine kinase [Bacillota bacterium]|nr:HAMP domain-containing histidine kinase [Bacillota bacterium]